MGLVEIMLFLYSAAVLIACVYFCNWLEDRKLRKLRKVYLDAHMEQVKKEAALATSSEVVRKGYRA